jgi:hypothetical protein
VRRSNTASRLPAAEAETREHLLRLVAEHRKRKVEPLHLAIHFQHQKHKQDICLFEVLGEFGNGQIDLKRSIFEVVFSSNPNFPMPGDKSLRLFLSSPEELREAIRKKWPSLTQVRHAVQSGEADVLFSDKTGKELLRLLA